MNKLDLISSPMWMGSISPGPPEGGGNAIPPAGQTPSAMREIFWGPNGLRAGWRLLIFVALLLVLGGALSLAVRLATHGGAARNAAGAGGLTALNTILGEGIPFLLVLLVSWIMTKIEMRSIADYGLPWRNAFRAKFWEGMVWGFAALTGVLLAMRAAHSFYFGTLALHGGQIARFALMWLGAFLLVGFFEEFLFRGYAQFTLTTGMGFWPSAILLSGLFGATHLGNPGETYAGGLSAGLFAFLFCLILRRTGDLWLAIGFHCSWDWGQSFFYGVPDSGLVAQGHLLNSTLRGPRWLSGGTVGPEASIFCFIMFVVMWLIFSWRFPTAQYPNPAALGDPRKRARAA